MKCSVEEAEWETNTSFVDSWCGRVEMNVFKCERVSDFIVNYIGVIVNIEVLKLSVVCVEKGIAFDGWCERGRFSIFSKASTYKSDDRVRKLVFENNVGCERSVNWEEEVIEYLSLFEK